MTDLTGVELAEATAYVLGFRDDDHRWRHSGTFYIHRWPNETMPEEWRPDQGGAAAWEVLEWVLGQRLHVEMWRDRLDGCTVCWILDRPGNGRLVADGIGPADGPTDAIALCRAVVALGEAG